MNSKLSYFQDPNFRFNESSHTYTYLDPTTQKPVQIFTSVTGFISQFKEKFDSEFWAKKKALSSGKTKDAILNEWKETSEVAMDLGTAVHKWIEDFYAGLEPELPSHPEVLSRVLKFKELYRERLHKLTIISQEFRVFSRKWGLAGTLDALFCLNQDNYVGDWKTNKKFTTDDSPNGRYKRLLYPFEDLWDNSLNGYSIQLSLYRLILQEEAGFRTTGAFLCWIGPDEKPKLYKAVDLRDRLYEYLQKNNLTL